MKKEEYYEKLKDPRWQKKRLEILERDEYMCQSCYNSEMTLHVHHMVYNNCEPWDIPNDCLTTLCERCHNIETEQKSSAGKKLLREFKKRFHAYNLEEIADGLSQFQQLHETDVVASSIAFMFKTPEMNRLILDKFFEYLRGDKKNGKK